jgi:hypothetical protein
VPATDAKTGEPRVKGAAIREFLLWYDEQYGHEATLRLAEAIPPSYEGLISPSEPALGVLGASWYPSALVAPMLDSLAATTKDGGRQFALEANRAVVPRMIRGVYRVLFDVVATPERYAQHVGRLWRRLHTTGDRRMRIVAPGEAFSTVESWPGHHPLLCWITIYTMAFLFEAMGYTQWSVDRIACVSDGAARCATTLRYRKA